MDRLESEIANKRQRLVALEAERATLVIEVGALERAAELRPVSMSAASAVTVGSTATPSVGPPTADVPKTEPNAEYRGGRKPGAISEPWRKTLAALYGRGRASYGQVRDEARNTVPGEVTLTSVRDRVRELVRMGHMIGDAEHGFEVTQAAAERFSFTSHAPEGAERIGPLNGNANSNALSDPVSGSVQLPLQSQPGSPA